MQKFGPDQHRLVFGPNQVRRRWAIGSWHIDLLTWHRTDGRRYLYGPRTLGPLAVGCSTGRQAVHVFIKKRFKLRTSASV